MITTSLDIETTSLSPDSGVPIQLGAVVFDTESPEFENLGAYSKVIGWNVLTGQPGALSMNSVIIERMNERNKEWDRLTVEIERFKMTSFQRDDISPSEAAKLRIQKQKELQERNELLTSGYVRAQDLTDDFSNFLISHNAYYKDTKGKQHLNLCGKNIMNFDLPFLRQTITGFKDKIRYHYRTLDPGTMYSIPSDEVPPNLELCKKRAQQITMLPKYQKHRVLFEDTGVKHLAYEDALDVALLIWFYYKLEEPIHKLITPGDGEANNLVKPKPA